MEPFERLAVVYFLALALTTPLTHARASRMAAVALGAVGLAAAIVGASMHGTAVVRGWLPHLYLVLGYWMPALLVSPPAAATRFERRLLRSDEALRHRLPEVPYFLEPVVEAAYLVCYPLVPASFLVVWLHGSADDVAGFWFAVLLAGYACYVSLPWLISRPPRLATGSPPAARHVASINVLVLGRVSHQLNTFPSGHAAVATAAAITLMPVSTLGAIVVGVFAAGIAIGAASGRYHYVIDVVLGVIVGAIAGFAV